MIDEELENATMDVTLLNAVDCPFIGPPFAIPEDFQVFCLVKIEYLTRVLSCAVLVTFLTD